jgi:hypothetical protein
MAWCMAARYVRGAIAGLGFVIVIVAGSRG